MAQGHAPRVVYFGAPRVAYFGVPRVTVFCTSVSKGCQETLWEATKEQINVPNETLSEKYLGMPANVGRSINGAFQYLKDRVWKHVQGWLEKNPSEVMRF